MSTAANKRHHARAAAKNLVVNLLIEGSYLPAPVEDISMGGMRMRGPDWIGVGSTLSFDLVRPGLKRPLRLSGVVVDARAGRGIGIRFDALEPAQSERLAELVSIFGGSAEPTATDVPRQTERERKLEAQVRALVMEVGQMQEVVQQRERELRDARSAMDELRGDLGGQAELKRLVDTLKAENVLLDAKLREERDRHRAEVIRTQREAQAAMVALARLLETLGQPPVG